MDTFYFDYQIREAERILEQARWVRGLGSVEDMPCDEIILGVTPRFVAHSYNRLKELMRWIIGKTGAKNWEITNRFSSGPTSITCWKSEDCEWGLWLQVAPEDYPPELQSDKCRWVRSETGCGPRVSWDYVCEVSE